MNISKKYRLIALVLNLISAGFAQADSISAAALVSAEGIKAWEDAFREIEPDLSAAGIVTEEVGRDLYHLTLLDLDVKIKSGLTRKQKESLRYEVYSAMNKAVNTVFAGLTPADLAGMRLKFKEVRAFGSKIAAAFESNTEIVDLLNRVYDEFCDNIDLLIDYRIIGADDIKDIKIKYPVFRPHISLAKIKAGHGAAKGIVIPRPGSPSFSIKADKKYVNAFIV